MNRRAALFAFAATLLAPRIAAAQQQTRWRFQFADAPARDHVRVTPDMTFDVARGFGFEPGAPSRFSLAVPEGDYRVTVQLISPVARRVLAEDRRLMLQPYLRSRIQRSFVVNVRNARLAPPPPNAPGGDAVRLSARESGALNWDDKLTLEFANGPPQIVSIERVDVPRIFLLGDSTVADQAAAPFASWGQMLPRFFGDGVSVANHAQSGESLRTFLAGLRLEKVLSQVRPADWALIQFGHNDQKSQWPQSYAPAETTYRTYLRLYIEEIRRRGGQVVLVTSPQRRTFNASGRIENSHGAYPDAVRAVATEMNAPLIDLHAISTTLYETLGPERSLEAFAPRDGTHHNTFGAYQLAHAVASAMRSQNLPLARYLREDVRTFDPAHLDSIEPIP